MTYRILIPFILLFSADGLAMCRDRDAWAAGDEKAKSFFKESEVFKPARVQKVHHPSRKKEVVSYVKTQGKYYSIFTLVDENCQAVFRKRTRQGD